jgi:uncharacterized protein (DUF2141 family)
MNTKYILIVITILFFSISAVAIAADVKVKANITGIENEQGVIRVSLYSEAIQDRFPDGKALEGKVVDAKKEGVSVTFDIIKPGYYAIAVMHDENNNGKMETNFLGIPKEPYGNSGEYTSFKPKFKDSKFLVVDKNVEMNIKVH